MAAAIILVHNHPSGDPAPSPDDIAITRAIVQAGKLLERDRFLDAEEAAFDRALEVLRRHEPRAPAVLGPHTFNFPEATQLALAAGAALQARDALEAMRAARSLLGDAERRARMGAAGIRLCAAHRGATGRHLAVVRGLLEAAAPAEVRARAPG